MTAYAMELWGQRCLEARNRGELAVMGAACPRCSRPLWPVGNDEVCVPLSRCECPEREVAVTDIFDVFGFAHDSLAPTLIPGAVRQD